MGHLSAEELIDWLDAADNARDPHLAECAACRAQLEQLRATLASVADVEVPEPSRRFWREFSDRIHRTIEAERSSWWRGWLSPARAWPRWSVASAVAVVAVAVAVGVGRDRLGRPAEEPFASRNAAPREADEPLVDVVDPAADPQMALVVDLATGLDWDEFGEAGLTPRAGDVDGSLSQLTDGERAELERLLSEAMAQAGA